MIFTINTNNSPKHLNSLLSKYETVFTEQKKKLHRRQPVLKA